MKKMNNKGFSLVELIIVIAIMAILIAVLAPQYLRYVEKSRLQSDNSAIGELANAIKIAAADDKVNSAIQSAGSATATINHTTGVITFSETTYLQPQVTPVVGSTLNIKSNKYKKATADPVVTVSIDSNGVAVVTGSDYFADVNDTTATNINF